MFDFRGLVEKALAALDGDRPAEAEKAIRAALELSPRDDQLLHLLGVSLIRQQREEEAIEPLKKAISLNRRDAEYHNALGCALRNIGRPGEGVESLQRAIKLEPGLLDAHFNLGQSYQGLGELHKAEAKFRELLARAPGDVEVVGALANLCWFSGDHQGAVAQLREFIGRNPASGDMRFLLSEQLLALGAWEEGWHAYLWRMNRFAYLRTLGLGVDDAALCRPLPADLAGTTIRVHAEQGIGDDLFFLRFAPGLRARGARVVGEITPRLVDMVARSGVLDEVRPAAGRSPQGRDARLLGDLPHLLEAHRAGVPPAVRFAPRPADMAAMAERLAGLPRPLIGLTWRAGTGPESGKRNVLYKAVPFQEFVAMAPRLPGTLLVLQREPKPGEIEALQAAAGPRCHDFSALNGDLEAMHALLAQIDDYVCVSNTNVHLRAALGLGCRVFVSGSVEFRWMAAGDSPWFPESRVYRQGPGPDWAAAIGQVVSDFSHLKQ